MKIKTITLRKVLTFEMACFAVLFSGVLFAPLVGVQAITGPLVNAVLFLAVIFTGVQGAVVIAFFPSVVALVSGFLPAVIAPMIPFIITGNVILVLVFNRFQKSFWSGIIFASFSKFLFLAFSSLVIFNLVANETLARQATVMMSWTQLLTALVGGLMAYIVILLFGERRQK